MRKSFLGRIVLPHTFRSFICPSIFWAHHIQLLLILVSSNDFSTTHLAGLRPLFVSKIVIGLSAACSPHHSHLETQWKCCADSLPFFTQWTVNINQTAASEKFPKSVTKWYGWSYRPIWHQRVSKLFSHRWKYHSFRETLQKRSAVWEESSH